MGIDCLIISTNRVVNPYPVYPIGAACIADALVRAGHRATHYDLLSEGGMEGLHELLSQKKFDLAAVSIRNLDTVDSSDPLPLIGDSVEVVRLLRTKANTPVVIGGPAFSIMPEILMDHTGCDYGISGEGEELIVHLADLLEQGRKPEKRIMYGKHVKGFRGAGMINDSCAEFYLAHGGMLNIQTKRGCPYACAYCSYPNIEGRTLRFCDPDEVAWEFSRMVEEFGARYMFFTDSVFNDYQGHYIKVAEALVKSGNKIPWCAFFRPADIEDDVLELLRRSGLAAMEIGTDASTDITLSALDKGFLFKDAVSINTKAVAQGIPCAHYIIFGGPQETEATVIEGLENIELLEDSVAFAFLGIRILPDTKLHKLAISEGIIEAKDPLLDPVFYFSKQVSREFMDREIRKAWHGKIERIYPCAEAEDRVRQLHKMGYDGPMWDHLIRHRLRNRT